MITTDDLRRQELGLVRTHSPDHISIEEDDQRPLLSTSRNGRNESPTTYPRIQSPNRFRKKVTTLLAIMKRPLSKIPAVILGKVYYSCF